MNLQSHKINKNNELFIAKYMIILLSNQDKFLFVVSYLNDIFKIVLTIAAD